MKPKKIHSKKELQERRRELRKNMTPAEAFLWSHIKARQLDGKRFTKQHSIGYYIVDFYCASQKLIIELDGEVHNNPTAAEYDQKRTAYLNGLGYKVLRFENKMVFDFLSSVLDEIKDNFQEND
ncbi:endonuclease domain-containing protein [Kriegella aquimaris]|nr:endonuclease domain-containing protein [Kriegella aquimaris]